MASLGTLAMEDYTGSVDIAERIGWDRAGSRSMVTLTNLPTDLIGTQWLDMGTATGNAIEREFFGSGLTPSSLGKRQIELTAAIYIQAEPNSSSEQYPMEIRAGSSSTNTARVRLYTQPDAATGLNRSLAMYLRTVGGDEVYLFNNDLKIIKDQLLYVTLRMESGTGTNADGQAEIWCNGELVASQSNIQWDSDESENEFTPSSAIMASIRGSAGFQPAFRNVMINDGFTTTFGTKPEYKHVFSPTVSAMVGAQYSTEGTLGNGYAAVSDGVDTNYVQTVFNDAVATFDFNVDANLGSYPVRDVEIRMDASRGNAEGNTINMAFRAQSSQIDMANASHVLTTVDPSREEVQLTLTPAGTTTADNFLFVVVNGN